MTAKMTPRQFRKGVEANNPPSLDGNPIGGGLWMRIDGLEKAGNSSGSTLVIEPNPKNSGSYGTNHGMLEVTDEQGRRYMAPDTSLNRSALKAGGYENNGGWVEMTHGERFIDEVAQAEFKRMRALALDQANQSLLNDRSVDVTGAYYDDSRPLKKAVKQVSFASKDIGTYNISDTGIIAFVNVTGQVRLGVQNPLRGQGWLSDANNFEEKLQQCGYRKSESLEVPFAHDEKPLKPEKSDQYNTATLNLVPDTKLEQALMPYRSTREYLASTHVRERETQEGREHASRFLKAYRGSRPVGAYADHVRNQQTVPGEDSMPGRG